MAEEREEAFSYYSDFRLPEKLKNLVGEARREGKGHLFSVLIVKDSAGDQYEIILRKDLEQAVHKYIKKHGAVDLHFRLLSQK